MVEQTKVFKVNFDCATAELVQTIDPGPAYFNPNLYFFFKSKQECVNFGQTYFAKSKRSSSLANSLKPVPEVSSKWKKFNNVKQKRSIVDIKIDAVLSEFDQSEEKMLQEIQTLTSDLLEANQKHEHRLKEKTATLVTNIKYYGSKVQELIEEIVLQKPYDPETGKKNTLENTVKQLGIDAEKIKFEDGEFKPFD